MMPIDIESAHIKRAIVRAGAVQEGHYELNGGRHALRKVDLPVIVKNPRAIQLVQNAVRKRMDELGDKVVVPVPTGGVRIVEANEYGIVKKDRVICPNKLGPRHFELEEADKESLQKLGRVALLEDVVKSGGTAAALATQLKVVNPELTVDLIGVWLRARQEPKRQVFDTQSYLVHSYIEDWRALDCPHPLHYPGRPIA